MKNKKKFIIMFLLILIVLIFAGISFFNKNQSIVITFRNNTNYYVENLKLNYTNLKNDINIPTIKPNDTYCLIFDSSSNDDFYEGSMKIYYIEKDNKKVEKVVIPYFERGYKGKVDINIESDNNNFKFDIKDNVHW